jgi:glycosyltransferase involved in cell wall biosynthesis
MALMKKLLYITNGIKGAAGLERVLSVKATYLADEMGYDVHILTLNNGAAKPFYDFSPRITMHDVAVGGNPIYYINGYIRGIGRVVEDVKPDIISVCDDGLKGFFLPMILKKPCPMVYERHVSKVIALGQNPSALKQIKMAATFLLMNRLGRSFDRFVVLTSDNKKEWNLDNLQVISNPLSFYPRESSRLNQKKVIAVGKQSYQKGFDRLLKSWVSVQEKHPDWKLEIYGTYIPSQQIPELAQKLGLHSVSFFEPVKNIEEKYLESSVFAFPSRFEGFGMVLIEAMACGVPCVSFDCPCGPADIIADGHDGFLVPNGDVETFTAKLLALIENENLRIAMGQNARQNVKRYLPETIVPQWDALFKSLLS